MQGQKISRRKLRTQENAVSMDSIKISWKYFSNLCISLWFPEIELVLLCHTFFFVSFLLEDKKSKSEWMLNHIRIENIISTPIWVTNLQYQGKLISQTWKNDKNLILDQILAHLAQIWPPKDFLQVLPPLVVRHFSQLSCYVI